MNDVEALGLPLDADIADLIDREVRELRTLEPRDVAGMRGLLEEICRLRRGPGYTAETVDAVEDDVAGTVPVRIYWPSEPSGHSIMFLHGGGWVFGHLDSHDDHARALCRRTGAVVVSVDYRLAPETKFPGPLHDCLEVLSWMHSGAHDLLGPHLPLTIAGDSAGGNLAIATALVAQRENLADIEALCLIYPVLDARRVNRDDYRAEPGTLTERAMDYFVRNYLSDETAREDSRVSAVLAPDLQRLPAVLLASAAHDPLRSQADAMSVLLERYDVPHRHIVYAGMVHGFFGMAPTVPAAAHAVQDICDQLCALWARAACGER